MTGIQSMQSAHMTASELGLHHQGGPRLIKSDGHTGPQALTHGQHVLEVLQVEGHV